MLVAIARCVKIYKLLYSFILQDDATDKKATIGNNKVNGSSILSVPGGGDSPLGNRKRSGSTGEESNCRIGNGDVAVDFDLLKQELVLEIRKEINRVKQEIIEGKSSYCFFNIQQTCFIQFDCV